MIERDGKLYFQSNTRGPSLPYLNAGARYRRHRDRQAHADEAESHSPRGTIRPWRLRTTWFHRKRRPAYFRANPRSDLLGGTTPLCADQGNHRPEGSSVPSRPPRYPGGVQRFIPESGSDLSQCLFTFKTEDVRPGELPER